MTNIQAIDLLKGLEQSLDDYCELNDEGKTAFHMAITALEVFGNSEQLPSAQPERTDKHTETHACDLISRQAAIDALRGYLVGKRCPDDGTLTCRLIENEVINKLPPIQPEIVRCGECKWFQCNMRPDGYLPQGVDEFECRHWCGSCDPTDFCSYGEKERGEQNG